VSAPSRLKREPFERQREGFPMSAPSRLKREPVERRRDESLRHAPSRLKREPVERQRAGFPMAGLLPVSHRRALAALPARARTA
jgi:hypothetical protein